MTNYGPYIPKEAMTELLLDEAVVYEPNPNIWTEGKIVGCFSKNALQVAFNNKILTIDRKDLRYRYPLDRVYIKENYLPWFGKTFDTLLDYQIREILKINYIKLKQGYKATFDQLMQDTDNEIMNTYKR